MCPPDHFDVTYRINPWMEPTRPTDARLASRQWRRLLALLRGLGHRVELIDPAPGLPDMVFAANAATVIGDVALTARFRHPQRRPEAARYARWFREHGYDVRPAAAVNEGQGDIVLIGKRLIAGSGFRTDPAAHPELAEAFGRQVVGVRLVDPRYYHLDTALAVLDDEQLMYYPRAFAPESRALLRELYPDAIEATAADAEVFGLNAVCDGRHVLLAPGAVQLAERLAAHGYVPIGVDLSELLKAGGGAKCCVLELHDEGGDQ
jgi:N-dimethylarginine dimethylaminohydrolase